MLLAYFLFGRSELRRILFELILGLTIIFSLGTSVFAAGSPDAIIVDSNAETKVAVVPGGDSDTPPDVYIKKPDDEAINPTGEH